jgi:hypothetical protein
MGAQLWSWIDLSSGTEWSAGQSWRDDQYAQSQKTPIAPKATADQIRSDVASTPTERTTKMRHAAMLDTPSTRKPVRGNSRVVM